MTHSIGMISRKLTAIVSGHPDPDVGRRDRAPIDEPTHDGAPTLDSGACRAGFGTPVRALRPG